MNDLGKRAVDAKAFRWMPGMKAICVREGELEPVVQRFPDNMQGYNLYSNKSLPDFTDPATVGCLLAMVRIAWYDETISVARYETYSPTPGGFVPNGLKIVWICHIPDGRGGRTQVQGATEAEALVAALEAAES